jgi:hypothetical protein
MVFKFVNVNGCNFVESINSVSLNTFNCGDAESCS